MRDLWRSLSGALRRIVGFVALFVVARITLGLALIGLDRDAIAWSWEATLVIVAALAVPICVGLVLRRRAPRTG